MKSLVAGLAAPTRAALYAGVAVLGLAVPHAALAQEAGEAQPATDAVPTFEEQGNEIVVTATKREQTLQDVPVAVTVTTAETIERAQIRDIRDLATVVPSLRVTQLQSSANTNFIIRGFGNGANNAGIEPSVGVFIDGVYRSRSAAQIADFPDVSRVEVLRGPQSTLFGKNASAGVISVITQEPRFDFGGNVEASYGNYDAVVVKGVVTGPVSESIAVSLAGGYNRRDGYIEDRGTGDRTNERNRWFVRGQALYRGDALKVRLIGDYSRIDENCCGVVNLQPSSATGALTLLGGRVNPPADRYAGYIYGNLNSTNKIDNWGLSGQLDYELGPLTLTSITAYRETDAKTNQDSDFSSADLLGRNSQDLRINTFTQELRLATNLDGPVNALLGGFYFNEKIRQSNQLLYGTQFRPYADLLIRGGSPGLTLASVESQIGTIQGNPALYTNRFFGAGQGLTEGYRLNDESFSIFGQVDFEIADRLTLTGGINYTKDRKRFSTNVTSSDVFSGLQLNTIGQAGLTQQFLATAVGTALRLPAGTLATPAQIGAFAAAQPAIFANLQGQAAAFGTLNANLTTQAALADTNPLTVGNPLLALRPLQFLPPFLNVPNAVENGRTSDGNVSYTARLAYDATDTVNVYVSFATGFKASSVNLSRDSRPTEADRPALIAAGLPVANQTYGSRFAGPEKSTVYEAGLKGNWGVATANIAVFKQIIRGFQSNIFTGSGFYLSNAGKQSTFGIEFEGMVRPVPQLTLTSAVTYLNPKYDEFLLSSVGDLSGTRPSGVPPLSVTMGATWDQEISNGDRIILRGNWHYEATTKIVEGLPGFLSLGTAAAIAAARPFTRSISEFDASATYAMQNGLEFTVWGRNLSNHRYIISVFDSPAQPLSISGYPNQPRTYGASVRYRW